MTSKLQYWLNEDRAFWEMRKACAVIDLELAEENLTRVAAQLAAFRAEAAR